MLITELYEYSYFTLTLTSNNISLMSFRFRLSLGLSWPQIVVYGLNTLMQLFVIIATNFQKYTNLVSESASDWETNT